MKIFKFILIHLVSLLILIPSAFWIQNFPNALIMYFVISLILQISVPLLSALYARKHRIVNPWINFALTVVSLFLLHYISLLPAVGFGSITITHQGIFNVTCITLIPTILIAFTVALIYQINDSRKDRGLAQ